MLNMQHVIGKVTKREIPWNGVQQRVFRDMSKTWEDTRRGPYDPKAFDALNKSMLQTLEDKFYRELSVKEIRDIGTELSRLH